MDCYIIIVNVFHPHYYTYVNVLILSLIGYYLQYIMQLGFHTDAFAQQGNSPDGKEEPLWMNWWTIFYWGWWIAWCPFVGMFIAKISRGRTIREFILYTLTVPSIYIFFWFSIFGGMLQLNYFYNIKIAK